MRRSQAHAFAASASTAVPWLGPVVLLLSPDLDVLGQTSPPERVALFVRAFAFSTRETELIGHLTTGADTRELARRMFLSEHTVQDHLKSIFAKTSTHNRRALLSLTLGG